MRALLVEDDEDLRDLTVYWLTSCGYQTVAVANGALATQVLLRDLAFDVLITDFQMPEMDGLDLLTWCREKKIHFPVIFATAHPGTFPREKLALADCCADFLRKPFFLKDFTSSLQRARERNHELECRRAGKAPLGASI